MKFHIRTIITVSIILLVNPLYAEHLSDVEHRPVLNATDLLTINGTHEHNTRVITLDTRSKEDYAVSHIPGAIHFPVELSFDQVEDKSRIVRLQEMRKIMSELGILNSDYLIIYDAGSMNDAAHVYWMLQVYGHELVSVLDGGFQSWTDINAPIEKIEKKLASSNYVPSIAPHHYATKLTVRLAEENDNITIIDSRSEEEFIGEKSKAVRSGRIPGAVNIPAVNNLLLNKTHNGLKTDNILEALYKDINRKNQIITYCNRGRDAALSYLVLRKLGYSVSIYDGSWLEWAKDSELPIISESR